MQKRLCPANSRGKANFGWLQANYSFSFANYFNPENIQFGLLRVLNDDTIEGGMGFGTHPHENMEIITIPLKGTLKHKDSMNNSSEIKEGEVQVMSAGTGVTHSEFNASKTEPINLLQLWIFSEEKGVAPRYGQFSYASKMKINELYSIVRPKNDQQEGSLWIHQQAYLSIGEFESSKNHTYSLHQENQGVYIFMIEGEVEIEGEIVQKRDALEVWDTKDIPLKFNKPSKVLVIEVPLN